MTIKFDDETKKYYNNLKHMEKKLKEGKHKILKDIRRLSKIPKVAEYINKERELEVQKCKLSDLKFRMIILEHANCTHPLWYLLRSEKRDFVIHFTCKCVICGKQEERIKKDFHNNVIYYNFCLEEWKRSEYPPDEIERAFRKMIKAYNEYKKNNKTLPFDENYPVKVIKKKYNKEWF